MTKRVSFQATGHGYHDVYINETKQPHLRLIKDSHCNGHILYHLVKNYGKPNSKRLRSGTRAHLRDDIEKAINRHQ